MRLDAQKALEVRVSISQTMNTLHAENDLLKAKLSRTKAELEEAKEVIRQILGWRELRETNEFPLERIEQICSDFLSSQQSEE